ncbi:MAG: ABC transporter permease [Firmicutes bacterium]|nr:ABC transporter permease [Bacillota bacterium]
MRSLKVLKGAVFPIFILIIWLLSSRHSTNNLIPAPNEVINAISNLWARGEIQKHVSISLIRVLKGFGWAAIIGVPLGLCFGVFTKFRLWLMPTLHFLRQIPPIAWIPLFLIWFGIGEGSKSAVIFYAAFFPVLLNSLLGIEQIPRRFWEVGKVLEFDYLKFLWRLVLPASLPSIMAGLRLGMSMSWRALVAAEMIAATSGLGYLIMSARSLVRMDEMVVGILLIGLIGILIDAFFIWLERFLAPWNKETLGVGENERSIASSG